MGGGPLGISALEGAKRELKEETGMSASQWTEILRIHTSNSVTDEVGYVFVARKLSEGDAEPGETEQDLLVKKLPFQNVVQMVMENQITDSLSIAGILKVSRLLENGEL